MDFSPDKELLGFRTVAILPIVLFVPTMILGLVATGSKVGAALGVLFHLTILFVVSRMPAPMWAKAAGFGWLTLDVAAGAMTLNDVPWTIALPVRLGGHILAATWLITVSLICRPLALRIVGVVTGLWLGLFTFFASVLPLALLGPPGVLVVVWLGLLAWYYPTTPVATQATDAPKR